MLLGTGAENEATQQNFRSSLAPWKESASVRTSLSVGQIVIDPSNSSRMWFAEGMGVWRSDNISASNNAPVFNDVSRGMEQTVANDVVSLPNNNLIVAVSDRMGFHYTDPDVYPDEQISPSGRFSAGASIGTTPAQPNWAAVSIADTRFVEGACQLCGEGNVSGFSEDGGANWNLFGSVTPAGTTDLGEENFTNNPSSLQLGEIVVSASSVDNMVWVARNGGNKPGTTDRASLFYTNNKGNTWQPSSITNAAGEPVGDLNRWFTLYRRVLAADKVQGGTFYFYSWGSPTGNDLGPEPPSRIFKSTDGGASFQEVPGSANQLIFRNFWGQLEAAPENEGHLWFATGSDERGPVAQRGLFFSDNGGAAFTKIDDIIDAWAIGFGAKQAGQAYPTIFMYGETESRGWGAYYSTDQAATWQKIATYPNGVFNRISTINGDYDEFGKVYIGSPGGGFIYGVPTNNPNVAVTQVKLGETSLFLNQTTQALAFANGDATTAVSWSSSNPAVAEVNEQGEVTGKSEGQATITASSGGSSANASVTVKSTTEVTIPENTELLVDFDNISPSVQVDEDGRVKMFVPADGGTQNPADFVSSVVDNPGQGGINNSGKVARYEKTTGTTFQLIGFEFPEVVSLEDASSFSFQLYGPNLQEVYIQLQDESQEVFYDATIPVSGNNSWASVIVEIPAGSPPLKVASIFPNPNDAASQTFFLDNIGIQTGDTPPQSDVAVTGVSLNPTTLALSVGQTGTLSAIIAPANATNKSVSYASDNEAVATVSSSGVASAVAEGSAVITATTADGELTAQATVTVTTSGTDNPPPTAGNLVQNPGFEQDFQSWNVRYGANSISTAQANTGGKSGSLSSGGGFEQTISGLQPNTAYTLQAFARKTSGGFTLLGVKNSQIGQQDVTVSGSEWKQYTVNFTTGSATTLNVIVYGGNGSASFFDDFVLVPSGNARTADSNRAKSSPEAETTMTLYPNPSTGRVKMLMPETATVLVHNRLGQVIARQKLKQGQATLDLSGLSQGVYTVSTTIRGQRRVQRLVLE